MTKFVTLSIERLNQVIEALNSYWNTGEIDCADDLMDGLLAERDQKQVEQEAVAWCALNADRSGIAYFDGMPVIMTGPIGNEHHPYPLYTQPQPKREPLTDEQIDGIIRALDPLWLDTPTGFEEDFCRAIELTHGIGGEA